MLWDVSTTDLVTHLGGVSQLPRFSPGGRWLVTIQGDGAWLRDIDDGVGVHWLPGVTSWDHLAFGPGDASLVAASGGAVQLWDMTGEGKYQELLPPAPAGATSFTMVALSADGSCAAATDAGGHVHVWQLRAKPVETVDMLLVSESPARSLLLNPTGTRFITRSDDGIAALWSARTGAQLADLSAGSPVTLLALSGDGRWLATAHADQKVRVWHAADGAELRELPHGAPVCALVFSPEGRRLAAITAAAGKYVLHAWSLRPEATQAVTTRELDGRNPPIVHTSGRWLAYGDERLVHIWDVETGADLTAIYVDFADPDVILDSWKLEPVDARLPTSCGIQAATGAPVPLTQSKYLRIVSAAAPSENAKRSVQHWNAEHVHEAGALLATRRLVTTRSVVAGPTYADVTVDVSVVRYLPTISLEQLKGDIRHALLRFFDPLHGGPDKTGWPPGRAIYSSEVCQVVEAIKGVDHVECVLLGADQSENTEQLGIPPHSLVRATVITQVR